MMNEFERFFEITDRINYRIQMINRNLEAEQEIIENQIKELEQNES